MGESPSSEPPSPSGSGLTEGLRHLWHLEKESILKPMKVFQCGKWLRMPAAPSRACEQQLPGGSALGPVRGPA